MVMLRYVYVGIFGFLALMYILGVILGPSRCIEIGSCRNCWEVSERIVNSEYCPDPAVACTAEPVQQQHNAVVDTLSCACASARANDFADVALNSRVQEVFFNFFNKTVSTSELCSASAAYLVNVEYS